MKRIAFVVALVCIVRLAFAIDSESLPDPKLQARYQHLTRELRCVQCQNQTIADSDAPIAIDLRRELRELLESGKSDDEILKFLTDRYGDFILYRPPFVARTWLVWGGPVLVLLIALGAAAVIIRRRAQLPIDDETETGTTPQ